MTDAVFFAGLDAAARAGPAVLTLPGDIASSGII